MNFCSHTWRVSLCEPSRWWASNSWIHSDLCLYWEGVHSVHLCLLKFMYLSVSISESQVISVSVCMRITESLVWVHLCLNCRFVPVYRPTNKPLFKPLTLNMSSSNSDACNSRGDAGLLLLPKCPVPYISGLRSGLVKPWGCPLISLPGWRVPRCFTLV